MQCLECDIRYKQGKENVVADFLSRLPGTESQHHDNEISKATIAVVTRLQRKKNEQNEVLDSVITPD